MDEQPIGRFEHVGFQAEVYSTSLPGEFRIVYRDRSDQILEEGLLTGVSSYRQRESEIIERLKQLSEGKEVAPPADLTSSGEY